MSDTNQAGKNNQNTSNEGCGCGTYIFIIILIYGIYSLFGSDIANMLPFGEKKTETVVEEKSITYNFKYIGNAEDTTKGTTKNTAEDTTKQSYASETTEDPYANKTIREQINKHVENRDSYFIIKKNAAIKKKGEWKQAEDIVYKTQFDIDRFCFKNIQSRKNDDEGLLHVWITYVDKKKEESMRKELRKEGIKALNAMKLSNIKDNWEKLRKIHNYMAKHITYKHSEYDQTIYGALVKKHCVCTGYACLFAFFAKRAGIDAEIVAGYSHKDNILSQKQYEKTYLKRNPSIIGHAWNEINFNGTHYIIDATWDDPDKKDKKGKPYIEYSYFMTKPNTVKGRMSYSDYQKYDEKNGRPLSLDYDEVPKQGKDNYFIREGLYLKKYKRKDFQAILKKQYKKGKHLLTVRIGSKKEAVASEKDLVKNRHLNDVLGDIGYKNYYRYSGPSDHEDPDCLDWIIYLDPPN